MFNTYNNYTVERGGCLIIAVSKEDADKIAKAVNFVNASELRPSTGKPSHTNTEIQEDDRNQE
jgi:hypothetical protein